MPEAIMKNPWTLYGFIADFKSDISSRKNRRNEGNFDSVFQQVECVTRI